MMTSEMVNLSEKLDQISQQLTSQESRLGVMEKAKNGHSLAAIELKLDLIVNQLEEQKRRQRELEELKNDLLPIANHMIKLSIDELAEIGTEFKLEDLFFLIKRLLRDTHLLVGMLNQLESTIELVDESKLLGKQVFNQAVIKLDQLEREGYFAFARSGMSIFERIVSEFSQEDVEALGENIVTILKTVRNLTQPEIMDLTNNALEAMKETPITDGQISTFGLLKELSDPKVRRGLVRMLNLVKVIADQPISRN
jgi:uncharacterized protein YjgD (DUF1641 family)